MYYSIDLCFISGTGAAEERGMNQEILMPEISPSTSELNKGEAENTQNLIKIIYWFYVQVP